MAPLLAVVMSLTLAGNETWSRDSGWRPSEFAMALIDQFVWPGQSSACVSHYGQFLAEYVNSYYSGCGYTEDVLGLQQTPTLDASWNQTETDPTLEGCVRACFKDAPLPWGGSDYHILPSVDTMAVDPMTERIPFQSVNVVWSKSFNACRCDTDFSPLNNTLRVDDGWGTGNCSHEVYELPLGCLFTAEQGCTDAPRDSCLWTTSGHSCCLDSKGYNWKQNPALAWRYAAGSFLLILAIFSWGIVLQCSSNRRAAQQPNDNSLEAELIESHKQRYEAFLQKLIINITPEDTISQCSICLTDLTEQQCGRFPCGHKLHFSCMTDYVMYQIGKSQKKYPECPVCRQRVYDDIDGDDDDDDGGGEGRSSDRENRLNVIVPPQEITSEGSAEEMELREINAADEQPPQSDPVEVKEEERTSPPSPSASSSSSPSPPPRTDSELEVLRLAE